MTCGVADMGQDSDEAPGSALPIAIDRRLLAGEGLSVGGLSEFAAE